MNKLGRFLFRLLERIFGCYSEGPDMPVRFIEEARLFRVINPHASHELWEVFTRDMMKRAYQDGWVRGYEWNERWWPGPPPEAERLAEAAQHDWSLAKENGFWAQAMANVGQPRSARQVEQARIDGLRLQHAYRRQRRG